MSEQAASKQHFVYETNNDGFFVCIKVFIFYDYCGGLLFVWKEQKKFAEIKLCINNSSCLLEQTKNYERRQTTKRSLN